MPPACLIFDEVICALSEVNSASKEHKIRNMPEMTFCSPPLPPLPFDTHFSDVANRPPAHTTKPAASWVCKRHFNRHPAPITASWTRVKKKNPAVDRRVLAPIYTGRSFQHRDSSHADAQPNKHHVARTCTPPPARVLATPPKSDLLETR